MVNADCSEKRLECVSCFETESGLDAYCPPRGNNTNGTISLPSESAQEEEEPQPADYRRALMMLCLALALIVAWHITKPKEPAEEPAEKPA
jgi:hypothetical protein